MAFVSSSVGHPGSLASILRSAATMVDQSCDNMHLAQLRPAEAGSLGQASELNLIVIARVSLPLTLPLQLHPYR